MKLTQDDQIVLLKAGMESIFLLWFYDDEKKGVKPILKLMKNITELYISDLLLILSMSIPYENVYLQVFQVF